VWFENGLRKNRRANDERGTVPEMQEALRTCRADQDARRNVARRVTAKCGGGMIWWNNFYNWYFHGYGWFSVSLIIGIVCFLRRNK
jgi:hypothetical protein